MKTVPGQQRRAFSKVLMLWDKHNAREMPWKGEKDPYKVWLSEVILQQTRVEQGKPYYERFIRQYPTISDLANAPDQEVFRLWQGLGYYNRCKNMLAAARKVCKEYQGHFPGTYMEILQLPGVGEYTAAAIASFAFGLPYAVVDGNVQRVLARYFGIHEEVNSTIGKKHFAALAGEVLDKENPAVYNQAIMDFGATVCTPQQPSCHTCLLRKNCFARQRALTSILPVKAPKVKPRLRYFYYVVLCYRDKVYLHKRNDDDIWQNLHEFVLYEDKNLPDEKELLQRQPINILLKENSIRSSQTSGVYRQQLTHQVIYAKFLLIKLQYPLSGYKEHEYLSVSVRQLDKYAFPRIIIRYLEEVKLIK